MAEKEKQEPANPDDQSSPRKTATLSSSLIILLGICCLISVSVNFLHGDAFVHHHPDTALARTLKDFKTYRRKSPTSIRKQNVEKTVLDDDTRKEDEQEEDTEEDAEQEEEGEREILDHHRNNDNDNDNNNMKEAIALPPSKLGGLHCDAHGGPSEEDAKEMVYWSDIASDAKFVSPLHARKGQHRRYMTFEPDGGGWNNIRMAMETIVGLAIAMGRTLVLPPEQGMYLLRKDKTKQRTDFSFADFFPMHEMAAENAGLELITMEEFLQAEAMTGNLLDKETGKPSFPPGNRTNWNGQDVKELKEWLRTVTYIEHMWKPGRCIAAFPASGDHRDTENIHKMQEQLISEGLDASKFVGKPVAVDASPIERMHEMIAGRNELCVYDEEMQEKLVIHFMCYHKMRIRYLIHFYAFLFFEDWKQDLWMKRFMRDHMRYTDEIQCAAARIVHAVRERSRERGWGGSFDTFHIRRGDFQFKTTRISADQIYAHSKQFLTANKTIFVATDEKDKSFFDPLKKHFDVVFMNDYMKLLKGVNSNYYGMIDQLVASRGDVFFGCWFSTFTGFINRMRGYHSVKEKLEGYKDGTLPTTYYYATPNKKYEMHSYKPLIGGFFNREFPTSWRDIDRGTGELPDYSLTA